MKKILILPFLLFFLIQGSMAQTPKWVEKAKRAVFSVVTYDKNDKMLNTGNGFFVSEDGLALSDYTLFKGAERAVVITSEGKQMPVSLILGANDMYDVIKFRVAITEKKVPALIVAKTAPAVGADAWMLPYSTQKSIACVTGKVKEVSKQLHANPKAEICAFKGGEWIRIAGELVEDDRREARQSMLDDYPGLKKMYSADDGNTEVFYFENFNEGNK